MLRKLSETFTATHFTILVVTAILAPSALYATVATTAVSITDPNLGTKSLVDAARRLWVFDPIAGYQNNPQNFVRVDLACSPTTNSGTLSYNLPSGKAHIIRSIDFNYNGGVSGADNFMYIYNSNNGTQSKVAFLDSNNSVDSRTAELGNGYFVRNGEYLYVVCGSDGSSGSNGTFEASVIGYFVPATQVPASDAAAQSARVGPAFMKNSRQM